MLHGEKREVARCSSDGCPHRYTSHQHFSFYACHNPPRQRR